jgi:hypothetical protein
MPAAAMRTGHPPLPEVPTWIVEALERAWTPHDWAYLRDVADDLRLSPGEAILRALVVGLESEERARRCRGRGRGARSGSARKPTAGRGRRC